MARSRRLRSPSRASRRGRSGAWTRTVARPERDALGSVVTGATARPASPAAAAWVARPPPPSRSPRVRSSRSTSVTGVASSTAAARRAETAAARRRPAAEHPTCARVGPGSRTGSWSRAEAAAGVAVPGARAAVRRQIGSHCQAASRGRITLPRRWSWVRIPSSAPMFRNRAVQLSGKLLPVCAGKR